MGDEQIQRSEQSESLEISPLPKKRMTEAEFFSRLDALVSEADESGLDYVGLLLTKYAIRRGSSFLESVFEYGFTRNRRR